MKNETLQEALTEASNWESHLTEEEKTNLSYADARKAAVSRVFEKYSERSSEGLNNQRLQAPLDYKQITSPQIAFEQAKKYDPTITLPDVSGMEPKMGDYILACAELAYSVQEINRNDDGTIWQPDFTGGERHYEPWHEIKTKDVDNKVVPSGVGFSDSYYGYWGSVSHVGARLLYRDENRWRHGSTVLESLYIRTNLMK